MAKNDWFVAGLNNPDLTTSDFVSIGDFNTSNTQFLKPEEYLKSDAIKNNEAFKDENGKFSKSKFDEYYQKRLKDFGDLQESQNYKGPALSAFDINRTEITPIKKTDLTIKRGYNPNRQRIGIEGVNRISDPEFSKRELAEQSKIFDFGANTFMENSVNDHALFSNPIEWIKDQIKDPLVLATWDEDGEHIDPVTGLATTHKKGENKLNEEGTYYYETLDGRSVIGKDVLAVGDTLTVDGKGLNKYDFFDSDDVKKSTLGIIAKNAVSVAPLFMGDWVSGIYSASLIARELSKAAPMIVGWATSYSEEDNPSWVNTLSAYGQRFTTSSSDYARENSASFENTASMIADIALQWGQQKFISQSFNKLRGASSILKDAELNAKALYESKAATLGHSEELWKASLNKFMPEAERQFSKLSALGQDASLVYMAITSNTGVYNDMLEAGATKREAAAVSFGSTLGMFAFDKYTDLGKIFFDDETAESVKAARQAIKNEFTEGEKAFKSIIQSNASQNSKYMQLMSTASDTAKRALSKFREGLKYHTLSLTGKMLGEGLEEVGEEAIGDTFKSIYELAGALGANTSVKDVKAFDNAGERYIQNFIGGAIGASVFYGVDLWNNRNKVTKKEDEDLATLIRNGHAEEVRAELKKLRKEGNLGDKNLSAKDYEIDSDGKIVWRTTENVKESQQEAVFNMIDEKINAIEEILTTNNANLSDDELFDNLVMQERRFKQFEKIAPITNYYQEFSKIVGELIQTEMDYRKASNTVDGTVNGEVIPNDTFLSKLTPEQKQSRQENIEKIKSSIESAKTKMNDFLSGDTSLEYVRKLNFAMDPSIHEAFLALDQEAYFQKLYPGKSIQELSPEEAIKFLVQQWPEYVQTQLKSNLDKAWNTFKDFEQKVNPHLEEMADYTEGYDMWHESLENFLKEDPRNADSLYKDYLSTDVRLEDESDEDYENRYKNKIDPITGKLEDNKTAEKRITSRFQKFLELNNEIEEKWIQEIRDKLGDVYYYLDPIFARKLLRELPESGRFRSMLDYTINMSDPFGVIKGVVKNLKPDLSNSEDILKAIITKKGKDYLKSKEEHLEELTSLLKSIKDLKVTGNDAEGNPIEDETSLEESLADDITIDSILDSLLENGHIKKDVDILKTKPENDKVEALKRIKTLFPELSDVNLIDLVQSYDENDKDNDILKTRIISYFKNIPFEEKEIFEKLIKNYKERPFYKFQEELKNTIKNPIGELIKKVAESNEDVVVDVDKTLELILKDFQELKDVSELELNDAQIENLEKVKSYMKMLQVYIRAASTDSNLNNPIGHNKNINKFAEDHKDQLRKAWNPLPEIRSDYATHYYKILDDYIKEIDTWLNFSNDNKINKIAKFKKTETVLISALWKNLSKLPREIEIDDDKFDILEGIETIDSSLIGTEDSLVALFSLEKLINKNIAKIAEDKEMSVPEFLKTYSIFEKLIPGLDEIYDQKGTNITDKLTPEEYSDYDKFLYLNTIMSEDPSIFYESLRNSVKGNSTIAPIITQELASRIAKTSSNPIFRENFNNIAQKYSGELPVLTNTTVSFGVAGAGKTQVVLNSIDRDIKDLPVLIAGPKRSQANAMQKAMSRDSSHTFEELFEMLLGKDVYNEIKDEINTPLKSEEEGLKPREFKHFTVFPGKDGLSKINLKDESLEFNNLGEKIPKAIYIDEATHLSTVEVLILDAYAKKIGAQVYLLGDPTQRGHFIKNTGIDHIDESSVFAVRTPKLTISLRDANLQKFQNQENVRTLLDTVLQKRKYDSAEEYKSFVDTAKSIMRSFNFRVYDKTELNGDFIVNELSDKIIQQLKIAASKGKTIAFIGDTSSTYLNKLREAGIEIPDTSILDINSMQGQEFDYVVIDHKFKDPTTIENTKEYLQDLYTLMTRAREASIFMDNNLSKYIGSNKVSPYKSKAPSIRDGVESLIKNKLRVLDKLFAEEQKTKSLSTEEKEETSSEDKNDIPKDSSSDSTEIFINPEEKFKDPEIRDENSKPEKELKQNAEELEESVEEVKELPLTTNPTQEGLKSFEIQAYGDAISLGVNLVEPEEDNQNSNPDWIVKFDLDSEEPRNLRALPKASDVENGKVRKFETTAKSYKEKIELQRRLFEVISAIKYRTSWDADNFPSIIKDNFEKAKWENGTFELEFREVSDIDVNPIHSRFKEVGMTYNGKTFIASIVFKVENRYGQICTFDLAGINNPETLINKQKEIKDSLTKAANQTKIESERNKLLAMAENVETASKEYKSWFDEQLENFEKGEGKPYSINVSDFINFNQNTWFVKRDGKPDVRLEGWVDPKNPKRTNANSLVIQNPRMVFSPIYTFTKKEADTFGIDPSISGKAVIFVSDDLSLSPDKLVSLYLNQKKDPQSHTPRIRMIMLNNFGMTFSQMISDKYLENFKPKTGNRKPFRQNFVGIRMFTSMWNTRAALLNFNTKFKEWQFKHGWSDDQVNMLLKAHYTLYANPNAKEAAINSLKRLGLTLDDIEEINKFNNEVLKDVPMFRLGYSTHENQFHIQSYVIDKDSKAYDGITEANLASIHPKKAEQFYNMLNAIFRPLTEPRKTATGLSIGLGLNISKDSEGNDLILENQYIDLKNAKHRRTLSGLLDHNDETMTISFEDPDGNVQTLAYAQGDQWSLVPKVVSSVLKKITALQRNPDNINDNSLAYSLSFSENNSQSEKLSVLFDIHGFFEGDAPYLKPTQGEEIDESLWNLMDLMFHGTTDDIQRNYDKDHPLMQLTDAYFKHGFLINPDISRVKDSVGSEDISGYSWGPSGSYIFYEISTNPGLFTVDVDMRTSGISLNLYGLKNSQKSNSSETTSVEPETTSEEVTDNTTVDSEKTEKSLTDKLADKFGKQFKVDFTEGTVEINGQSYNKTVPKDVAKIQIWNEILYLNISELNSLKDQTELKKYILNLLDINETIPAKVISRFKKEMHDIMGVNNIKKYFLHSETLGEFKTLSQYLSIFYNDKEFEILEKDNELYALDVETNILYKVDLSDYTSPVLEEIQPSQTSSEEIKEESSDGKNAEETSAEETPENLPEENPGENQEGSSDNNSKKEEVKEEIKEPAISTKLDENIQTVIDSMYTLFENTEAIHKYFENSPDLSDTMSEEEFKQDFKNFIDIFKNNLKDISKFNNIEDYLNSVIEQNTKKFVKIGLFILEDKNIDSVINNCN